MIGRLMDRPGKHQIFFKRGSAMLENENYFWELLMEDEEDQNDHVQRMVHTDGNVETIRCLKSSAGLRWNSTTSRLIEWAPSDYFSANDAQSGSSWDGLNAFKMFKFRLWRSECVFDLLLLCYRLCSPSDPQFRLFYWFSFGVPTELANFSNAKRTFSRVSSWIQKQVMRLSVQLNESVWKPFEIVRDR